MASIQRHTPEKGHLIHRLYKSLPDAAVQRFLEAPETSHRLLFGHHRDETTLADFLLDALTAEAVREGATMEPTSARWSARGEHVTGPPVASRTQSESDDFFIDYDSPQAESIKSPWHTNPHKTVTKESPVSSTQLGRPARNTVEVRLRKALEGLKETSAEAYAFVMAFTHVLVIRAHPFPDKPFTSSSPEKFIGLTVFWTSGIEENDAVYADALIHEAIHSLLDLDEYLSRRGLNGATPWFMDPILYDGKNRTVSPWTGNQLALLTFIHACVVWYAEVQFWSIAIAAGVFDPFSSRKRFTKALQGFLRQRNTLQLEPYRGSINPTIFQTLDKMQEIVIGASKVNP